MGFHQFKFSPDLFKGIEDLGFETPTPVQAQVIPNALIGHDIRACAQTGTGKTCAFVLPILNKFSNQTRHPKPSNLIIVPTRELGTQVLSVLKDVGKYIHARSVLIMGGVDIKKQIRQLHAGADIIVATPGRLLDHIERGNINLRQIQSLVLDEADRMFDMGFLPDIRRILSRCPKKRQTMLFSATFPPEILKLVDTFLHKPVTVDLAPSVPAENVAQIIYPISRSQKESFLKRLLEEHHYPSVLMFCRTKHGADHLASFLTNLGNKSSTIHSSLSQHQRDKALDGFRKKQFQILVATDIASRGIDVKDISHVINFDVPHNPEDYVHRIGRTGRAEASGDALTLMAPDEETYVRRIEKLIGKKIKRDKIEGFPYLVPPRLIDKPKPLFDSFGKMRRRIPSSRGGRFKR